MLLLVYNYDNNLLRFDTTFDNSHILYLNMLISPINNVVQATL